MHWDDQTGNSIIRQFEQENPNKDWYSENVLHDWRDNWGVLESAI